MSVERRVQELKQISSIRVPLMITLVFLDFELDLSNGVNEYPELVVVAQSMYLFAS